MKNISLKALAAQFNVSINTVSHALRDMGDISEELKISIRKKAIEMGYMPNHVSQKMKKDEKAVIAILVTSFGNLYFNSLLNELIKLLNGGNEYDYVLLCSPTLTNDIIKQCILQRVDLLITPANFDYNTYEFAKLNNIHLVFVGGMNDPCEYDTVTVDNVMGCVLAASYLNKMCQNNKFIYVGIGNNHFLSDFRSKTFVDELRAINRNAEIKIFNVDEQNVSLFYQYLCKGYRCIYCYNDDTVYKLMDKLKKNYATCGYPDFSIVGFDGLCRCVKGLEEINTVEIDYSSFAATIYQVAKKRIEEPSCAVQRILLPVTLHLKYGA